jgi:hypothetical protein
MRMILSEDGADVWQHGQKRGVITAEQIRTCGIVPGHGWRDALQGGAVAVGQLVLLLQQGPELADRAAAMHLCNCVGTWWMLTGYPATVDEHVMALIEHRAAAAESIITVVIGQADHLELQRDPLSMPLDIGWSSRSLRSFLGDDSDPTPRWVREDVRGRACPEGHTRVLFVVPDLHVSLSMVAEMEGVAW